MIAACFRLNYFIDYQYQKSPVMLNRVLRIRRMMDIALLHPSYGTGILELGN